MGTCARELGGRGDSQGGPGSGIACDPNGGYLMGQFNTQTMVDRVKSALGNPDSLLVSDDFILQWLNQTLMRITATKDFTEFCKNETITTTASVAEYTMSAIDLRYI